MNSRDSKHGPPRQRCTPGRHRITRRDKQASGRGGAHGITFDHQAAVEATEALEVPPAQLFCVWFSSKLFGRATSCCRMPHGHRASTSPSRPAGLVVGNGLAPREPWRGHRRGDSRVGRARSFSSKLRRWFILNDSEAQRLAAGALSFGFFSVLQFGSGRVYTETKTICRT